MRRSSQSYAFSVLALALLLGGCGLKGDLFLPPATETPEPVAAPEPPVADEDEEREDENEDG